jgi:hypothetical protein
MRILPPLRIIMQNTLFGVVGLTLGFLTPTQLSHALYIQEVRKNVGRNHTRLGELCVELGYLTAEQVEYIIDRSRVLRLSPYLKPGASDKSTAEDGRTLTTEPEARPISNPHEGWGPGGDVVLDETKRSAHRASRPLDDEIFRAQPSETLDNGSIKSFEQRYESLKSRYDTAIEQISLLTETVQTLRERELELAIRAETAEFELSELRQRMSGIERHMESGRGRGGLLRMFGR